VNNSLPKGDPVLLRAVQWTLLLRSGGADDDAARRFEAWRAEHPSHQAAYDRVAGALASTAALRDHGVGGVVAARALAGASRRTALRATLGVAGLGLGMGLVGWNVADRQGLLADQHTGTAQRRKETLPDGGLLWLDARTAVDVAFDGTQRELTLHHGRLLVGVQAQPAAPLHVQTPGGTVRADDARFIVQARDGGLLRLVALNGKLLVSVPGRSPVEVGEGHRAVLAPGEPAQLAGARGTEALWTQGLMAMDNEPLGELVEALQDYRPGWLRVDPQAAQLRISGVFSLDKPEQTLQALAETQPVRIQRRTPYWVTVQAA
jgi:transmembrane sensor